MPRYRVKTILTFLPDVIIEQSKEEIYHVYITDTLKNISENIAKQVGGGYISKRYYDIVDFGRKKEKDKTAEEIITATVEKSGIILKRKEE